ncbi:PREDICTED: uncharacterized protein LOC108368980 [Rhagoletis zephyria]|uniref:uncharacterized protein LOC108368980 n=1 Tax=Rhagoletis zephyria TaxID=28612 RepID=UPI0008115461|nr:PREDICTED: uncharacterized protein LOC108368980 [Rhagoletis zephyria]
MVRDRCNELKPCRALLDSGSQGTLITESCVQRLQLKRGFDRSMLYGVGSVNGGHTRGRVELNIEATQYDTIIRTEALCLLNLTYTLPPCDISHHSWTFFNEVNLADPSYSKPGKIDIILGADVFTSCLLPEKLTHPSGSPTAVNTIFGWVIMGKIKGADEQNIVTAHTCVDLNQQLQRFWEVEDLREPTNYLTDEEKKAELHFQQHTQRDVQGRYVVRLPLKEDEVNLGESRSATLRRLISVERRIDSDVQLKEEYGKFMDEYLELGHMEISSTVNVHRKYFMPHHAVFKPTSATTKLRVVFDASCKSSNGLSLNDNLLIGPTIQKDLFEIITKFRKYKVGFAGDIEKMYRQVLVHPDDRPLQRILWGRSTEEEPTAYDLRTVTYGTAAAPFLAVRTLQQVAYDYSDEYPDAASAISNNFM